MRWVLNEGISVQSGDLLITIINGNCTITVLLNLITRLNDILHLRVSINYSMIQHFINIYYILFIIQQFFVRKYYVRKYKILLKVHITQITAPNLSLLVSIQTHTYTYHTSHRCCLNNIKQACYSDFFNKIQLK